MNGPPEAAQPVSGMRRAPGSGDAVGMPATVLVVDDQEVVRDVIRLSLEGAGYLVREAASPLEAIALIRENCRKIRPRAERGFAPCASGVLG